MPAADPCAVFGDPKYRPPGFLEKLREALTGAVRPLLCLQAEITSRCLGGCAYCPHDSREEIWKSRHMRPETFASLWPVLRRAQRAHLQGWGEPFLHPHFFEFAAFARKAGARVSTTSSGAIMSEELAADIIASGMDAVAFSLAGTDAETNSIRQKIPFERVRESARFLRERIARAGHGPEIHIAYILLADRMEAAAKLPGLMSDFGADMCVVSTMDYIPDPSLAKLAIMPEDGEKIARARRILEKAAAEAEAADRFLY